MATLVFLFILGVFCFAIAEDSKSRVVVLGLITLCAIMVSALNGAQVAPLISLIAALASIAATSTRFIFRAAVTAITIIGTFMIYQAELLSWFGISISAFAVFVILLAHRLQDAKAN